MAAKSILPIPTSLEKQIEASRAKLAKAASKQGDTSAYLGPAAATAGAIGFQQLQVSQRFSLSADEGTYMLTLELPIAIDLVLLQSR